MHKLTTLFKKHLSETRGYRNRGQGLVEYVLLIALVGVVVVGIVSVMEPAIAGVFSRMVHKNAVAPPALAGYTPPPMTPTPSTYVLTINIVGDGNVGQNPPPPYRDGDYVSLEAIPGPGYEFDRWEVDLSGSNNPETIHMTSDKNVSAVFAPERFTLTVTEIGTGSGSVTLDPDQPDYAPNTIVTLTAIPAVGSSFQGWGGHLSGNSNIITLDMDEDKIVTADFQADCYPLTILESPDVGGDATVNPLPNCGGTDYAHGTIVTIGATSAYNYFFEEWTGDFTSSINPASVTMIGPVSVTANFVEIPCYDVNTNVFPADSGNVSLAPAPNCLSQYLEGTEVTFTAVPGFGNNFDHWSGDISSTNAVETLTINALTNVTAFFNTPAPQNLARRVNASYDDAEETVSNGSVNRTNGDLELIYDGKDQIVGIRFVDVQIEQGAAILNAYIQFTADESDSGSTSLVFEGQAADSPLEFDNVAYDISSRSRTSASVNWNSIVSWSTGNTYQTPDLAAIVQEIVDRGGWSSGNSMVFIISGSGKRVAESFNGDSNAAPLLLIEFKNP